MKTEQEQIEEIQEIIGDSYEYDSISAELGSGDGYINIEEAAKAIVEAGYGDVSEYKNRFEVADKVLTETRDKLTKAEHDRDRYKAEIERLKANNGFLQCVISHSKDMMDESGKEAQIDVLNKAKERLYSAPNGWAYTAYIDELIEEIEK